MPKLEFLYKGSITYWLKTQTFGVKEAGSNFISDLDQL